MRVPRVVFEDEDVRRGSMRLGLGVVRVEGRELGWGDEGGHRPVLLCVSKLSLSHLASARLGVARSFYFAWTRGYDMSGWTKTLISDAPLL